MSDDLKRHVDEQPALVHVDLSRGLDVFQEMERRTAALEAENARLREALKDIAQHRRHTGCEPMATPDECLEHVERIAVDALAEGGF